ncbi:MAG: hypothetical protein QM493_05125 [Sulfurovum sp.]
MLALNSELLDLYWNFYFKNIPINLEDKKILAKLFNNIQIPIKVSTHQNQRFKNPQLIKQQGYFFKITNKNSDEELIQSTILKLMLVNKFSKIKATTVNILNNSEKLQLKYGGTYLNSLDKYKAQQHIKYLLSDASWIKVIDSYIDNNTSQWNENKKLLKDIIPFKKFDLKIESGSMRDRRQAISKDKQDELNSICKDWDIGAIQYNDNIRHDRYIETNKLKILLSGGLYNLSSSSKKDFTYVIEIK